MPIGAVQALVNIWGAVICGSAALSVSICVEEEDGGGGSAVEGERGRGLLIGLGPLRPVPRLSFIGSAIRGYIFVVLNPFLLVSPSDEDRWWRVRADRVS